MQPRSCPDTWSLDRKQPRSKGTERTLSLQWLSLVHCDPSPHLAPPSATSVSTTTASIMFSLRWSSLHSSTTHSHSCSDGLQVLPVFSLLRAFYPCNLQIQNPTDHKFPVLQLTVNLIAPWTSPYQLRLDSQSQGFSIFFQSLLATFCT